MWTSNGILGILFTCVASFICPIHACLGMEQFLASTDHDRTLIFEAQLLQTSPETVQTYGANAYVNITRIIRQPATGWRIAPKELAHIRGIMERPVDSPSCLPPLVKGSRYVWVTLNMPTRKGSMEDSLKLYPGGLFAVGHEKKKYTADRPVADQNSHDQPHHDQPPQGLLLNAQKPPTKLLDEPPQYDAAIPRASVLSDLYALPDSLTCVLRPCPIYLAPVCGTDGATYQNECWLQQKSCILLQSRRPGIKTAYTGVCLVHQQNGYAKQPVALCESSNICMYGARCRDSPQNSPAAVVPLGLGAQQSWLTKCSCQHLDCSNKWPDPVCGSDGETYSSECFLARRICDDQVSRKVLYRGNCASNPCLGHTCRWPGEHCQVDTHGQPNCVCPDPCPRVIAPVCGSDGVTYDNHCELERTACLKMREIWVVYAGQCSAEPQCQALGLQCQGYEVCSEIVAPQIYGQLQQYPSGSYQNDLVPRQQQMVTRCLCPVCPEQGLGSQVCGTDGQTYRSECHLRASACQRQLDDLKVSSRGPCDSCKTKQCKFYSICQLNSLGEPECICPTGCLYVRKPVCGTDGKMYENECFLKVKACADQKEIHVAQEGHCKRCLYDCPLGYQCRNGECVCRDSCPKPNPLESEICGDDGKLYPSECELKRAACMQGKSIKIDLSGSCHRPRNAGKVFDLEGVPQADEVNLQVCKCNKYGALSEYCDKLGLCHCKWGATGRLCDKCVPGYWGLENGHQCIDCSCHRRGSLNTTCDQKTGQCICRPGIHGRQCSICPDGGQVTERGCLKDGTGPAEPEHREIPSGSQTPVADREHPENIPTSGRRFTPQTTLLVRAPFFLTMPTVLRLIVSLSSLDGNLLHCYVSPSKQESLTIENMRDHQISLSLIGGHVEFEYTDGRYLDRTFTVQTADKVQLNTPQIILAGISNGNPWVQLNYRPKTNSIDVKTKWISPDSSHQDELPSTGGRGTIMVGRRVVRYRDRNSNTLLGKEHPGIVGCLLQLRIEAGTPLERRDFDLLGGDMSEIAWLGVQQNEAPVCRVPEQTKAASIQSDSNQQHTMMTSKWEEDIVTEDRCTTEHPCRNGGTCVASKGNSYECICPPGWQGEECTQVATVIPEFNGNSFIRLPGPRGRQSMKHKRLRLELVFLATKAPGLLFYIPPSRSGAAVNPFIAAYIDQKGYLMVVCRVGIRQQQSVEDTLEQRSHVIFLRYPIPLKTNRWNVLTIDKRRKIMDVSVNGKTQQSIRLTPPQFEMLPRRSRRALTAFDLSSSPIYLGGYAGEDKHPFSLDVSVGFSGAIQKIKVNQAEVVLAGTPAPKAASYEYWSNVTQWQGPPCGPKYSPCAVDSLNHVCRPHGSQALCACSTPQQLWQILHERGDRNIDEAEKRACENRQAELNELSSDQKNDQSNDYMDEQDYQDIQYDGLPKPRSSIQQKPYEKPTSSGNSAKCGPLSVKFEGKTVFEFRGLVQSPNAYNVRLSLRTTSQDGLILLLINEDVSESSSYVQRQQGMGDQVELTILAMRKGRVEFSIIVAPRPVSTYETDYSRIVYSGAVSPLQLQAETRVNDGKCHSVHAVRSHRRVTLIIDNYMVFGEFLGNRIWSRSRNSAFLGGSMLNITSLPWEYQRNFTGCIAELYANEQQVGMLTSPVSIRGPLSSC